MCRLLSPLLLRQLLLWLEGNKAYGSKGGYPIGIGWLWALLLGMSGYLSTLTHHQAFWYAALHCMPWTYLTSLQCWTCVCSDEHTLTHAGVQYCQQHIYEAVRSKVELSVSNMPVPVSSHLRKDCAANHPCRCQSTGFGVLWRLHGVHQACVFAHTDTDLEFLVANQ